MAVSPLLALLLLLFLSGSGPRRCPAAAAANSTSSSSPSPRPTPLVPALFVIGDSTADVGTNNYLGTLARADREPYGRDFDTHRPTGRFSNGRIPVDYIAERLGVPFVPPYLEQNMRTGAADVGLTNIDGMIQGVNYASAAAGIVSSSGSELGMHVSLTQQVQQVEDTYEQLSLALGEAAVANLFRRSVFFVSIGSNDFIHYYLRNVSGVQMRYLPWEFNHLLVSTMRQGIKNLYDINVRKVILMDLPPVGCAPHFLEEYSSQTGECIDYINNVVIEFNYALRHMSSEFISQHPDSMISYCDTFEGSVDILNNREHYGFVITTDACCGLGMGMYGDAVRHPGVVQSAHQDVLSFGPATDGKTEAVEPIWNDLFNMRFREPIRGDLYGQTGTHAVRHRKRESKIYNLYESTEVDHGTPVLTGGYKLVLQHHQLVISHFTYQFTVYSLMN
ncbi:unnamed protein product [Miscanthus lutarioriparius]|uniref:Uncharacterized protein n=1 Tax=Miscanthus lutarioriparius TaxID=422564 RepID=A0A811PUP5_9POAL|nr:unnamed protein product [Miscanthus lutarioriparius]